MWHNGKRRFARQVCLRNPFPPFLLGISIIHSLPEAGSWEWQHAPPALHYGFAAAEKACPMRRSRGFGHGVMASRFVTHAFCEICMSLHSLPELRAAVRSTCFALWLHHAHPFVAAAGINLSDAEKQRVWSRSYGLQDLLQCSDCALSCAMWLLHQWTLVEIELLATVGWNPPGNSHSKMGRTCCFMLSKMGARRTQWIPRGMGWKWGCQPFSCRCSQNVTHCKRRFVGHVSFQEFIPAIPFGYSKHPLPARSRFLRAAECSTCFASWLHPAHPFVAAAGINLSDAEKQRVWSRSYGFKICYNAAIVLLVVPWDCCTNEHLSRLSF